MVSAGGACLQGVWLDKIAVSSSCWLDAPRVMPHVDERLSVRCVCQYMHS